MATKPTPKAPADDSTKALIEKLREIEKTAKHAADPREPAAQTAGALADFFAGK